MSLPIELSAASGVPYYRQITDQLGALIRSGRLSAGTQLPSVRDLAGQLLVSLITTRRAYADLEQEGLIERQQGRGTFVSERSPGRDRAQARAEARRILAEAVTRARQLGLSDDEQQRLLIELLEGADD